jgi:hypothetical protein
VNASRKLDAAIIFRAMLRAAMAWPIYRHRRPSTAAIPGMVPGREG